MITIWEAIQKRSHGPITLTLNIFQTLPSIPGTNGGVSVLGPVRREDADIYICTATNNFGHETKKMTQVEILCKYF